MLAQHMNWRIQVWAMGVAAGLLLGHRAAADSPFSVDVWNTEDGLPQSSVIAMTQTRDGYLWLGTLNGLVRFDGKSLTPFNINNAPGLPDNVVVFLFEDSQTNLWAVTQNAELCRIREGALRDVFSVNGANGKITAAFEDKDKTVWFATDGADIFFWRDGQLQRVSNLPSPDLKELGGHVAVPGRDGSRWRFKSGWVERWRGDRLEKSQAIPWGETVLVTAACDDGAGGLVAGTRGSGVYWLEGDGQVIHLTTSDGLSENYILSLCFDSEKNLWVGTDGGGLDRVKRKVFSTPAELAGGVGLSAAEDAEGGLWASFNLRGVSHWTTNGVLHYGVGRDSKPGPVLVDGQERIWVGTSGEGLFQFRDGNSLPVPTGPAGTNIYVLFLGRDGTVWAGGRNGLAGYGQRGMEFYSAAEGLPERPVRALADDAQGNLWIGTGGGGLYRLRQGEIASMASPLRDIACLLLDAQGALWAGSSAHGLARWQNGYWTQFTKADGLVDDVGCVIDDGLGNLWIGSYEGLLRVAKASLADFAEGRSRKIFTRTFLTRECSAGAQPAALRTRNGKLWFPTTTGFVGINPADLLRNTNPPPVVIESVLVDGVELKTNLLSPGWTGSIQLTPANEELDIHFTSLDFSAPKGLQFGARFRYRLEEPAAMAQPKGWTDIGTERVAHFSKLQPGAYTFHVEACNEDGVWNERGAAVGVTVQPPFWRRPGFIAAGILMLAGVSAGTIYLISTAKLRRQLRIAQQKEMVERERARIARDLHDQLGANLTQITLLGEMAEADKDQPGEIEEHAQQICATARDTTRSLDEIVWAVNPSNDTLESLANYACKYAQDYFAMAGVRYRSELPPGLPPAPILPEVRHNVFLAFKEAVNNVVKHARATEAHVKLELEPQRFVLSVTDNGRGLGDISEKKLRNGLKNMRRRLADVHGEFEILPGATCGTVVKLTVPIQNGAAIQT